MTDIYANSGNWQDIQTAVNTVAGTGDGTGTVFVPAGTFYWNGETVNIPTGVNVFGASPAGCMGHENNWASYTATTILYNQAASIPMFKADGNGRTDKSGRISNIQFELNASTQTVGNERGTGIWVYMGINYRIDHCTFINFGGYDIGVQNSDNNLNRVLIDHCVVDKPYKLNPGSWAWGYGFTVGGAVTVGSYTDEYWGNAADIYGKWETAPSKFGLMYIEDCHLSQCRHCTDNNQGGFYVVRFTLFDNSPLGSGIIGHHGTESNGGISYIGGRGFEAYNNTIFGTVDVHGVLARGGSSLTYNNTMTCTSNPYGYNLFVAFSNDDLGNFYPLTQVKQTYCWNNAVVNATAYATSGPVENTDYFLRQPNQAQDNFTYTPYPYPHSLVGEEIEEILKIRGVGKVKWRSI